MRKVISYTEHLKEEIIPKLRALYYGTSATAQEYKDSFVINQAVDKFNIEDVHALMSEAISEFERQEKHLVKTVNYRASSFFKISSISEKLSISHAEACRRVLYYSSGALEEETAPNNNYSTHEHELTQLKAKLVLLQGYMKNLNKEVQRVQEVIDEISNEIFKEGKNF